MILYMVRSQMHNLFLCCFVFACWKFYIYFICATLHILSGICIIFLIGLFGCSWMWNLCCWLRRHSMLLRYNLFLSAITVCCRWLTTSLSSKLFKWGFFWYFLLLLLCWVYPKRQQIGKWWKFLWCYTFAVSIAI